MRLLQISEQTTQAAVLQTNYKISEFVCYSEQNILFEKIKKKKTELETYFLRIACIFEEYWLECDY